MPVRLLSAFAIGCLSVAALSAPGAAQTSAVPDLLRRALTSPATSALYAYDFEDVSTGDRNTVIRGRIDPSRKKGERVEITFFSDAGEDKTDIKRIDERYERNAEGDIFCDALSEPDVGKVVDKGAAAGLRTFQFVPTPPRDAEGEMKAIMKKVTAEAVVDEATATLKAFTARLNKPHSIMMVAQVKSMSLRAECAAAPDGRSYALRREMKLEGSGLGRTFATTSVQTISNLRPAAIR